MNKIPQKIVDFIAKNHVVSLACCAENEIWAASCFYVFDEKNARLIVLTKSSTEHGKMLLTNPKIAGTIAGQPEKLTEIEGIQFAATARLLTAEKEKFPAQSLYFTRHPIAKLMPSEIWEIRLERIKHTENRVAFAQKTVWVRSGHKML